MWSEVLEADLFTRFLETGIFNRSTGLHYLESVLSAGDSEDPDLLYRNFMGRDPDPEALIRRNLGEL
jgi:oligopeptidase A